MNPEALAAMILGTLRTKSRRAHAGALALEEGAAFEAAADAAGVAKGPARKDYERALGLRDADGWRRVCTDVAELERRGRTGAALDVNEFARLALRWRKRSGTVGGRR